MEPETTKLSLREEMRAKLAALKASDRALQEELVTATVLASKEWANARVVAVYKAIKDEMSCVGITNAAWRLGKRVVFPRIDEEFLTWHEVQSWTQLKPGLYDIPAPGRAAPVVAPSEVDLWLVPGLAFNGTQRLGAGGGYYDRALPHRRGDSIVWGIGFDCQWQDDVPVDAHDVPIDGVVMQRTINMFTSA